MAKKIIHFHSRKYHVTTHDSPGVVCLVIWPKHACCDRNRRERNLAWINIYFLRHECMCEPKSTYLYLTRQSLLDETRVWITLEMRWDVISPF